MSEWCCAKVDRMHVGSKRGGGVHAEAVEEGRRLGMYSLIAAESAPDTCAELGKASSNTLTFSTATRFVSHLWGRECASAAVRHLSRVQPGGGCSLACRT